MAILLEPEPLTKEERAELAYVPPAGAELVECPFVVAIDTREQAPWHFRGLPAPAVQRKVGRVEREYVVPAQRIGLDSGDYSIVGADARIAIERKSKADLYSTLIHERDRFERELARLSLFDFAAVIVEATLGELIDDPPRHTRASPRSIAGSIRSFQQQFIRVHWILCDSRRLAESTCFDHLRAFYEHNLKPPPRSRLKRIPAASTTRTTNDEEVAADNDILCI